MSHGKQFTLYSHKGGPNGWKVAFLLEELNLTYEPVFLDFDKGEQKRSPHIDYNPNGRIPTIIDHKNADFVIWESSAIMQYLADKYDENGVFAMNSPEDKYRQLQWLFFQASGQGPYFGQGLHFKFHHPTKLPTAIERYQNETKRVISVLESVLSKQEWLVGGKFGIADMSFIPWHEFAVDHILEDYDCAKEAPHVDAWYKKMMERPVIKKVWADREAALRME